MIRTKRTGRPRNVSTWIPFLEPRFATVSSHLHFPKWKLDFPRNTLKPCFDPDYARCFVSGKTHQMDNPVIPRCALAWFKSKNLVTNTFFNHLGFVFRCALALGNTFPIT